ncbi:acetate--CoA ligase family protein [Salinifilum aidingensis]
MATSDDRRRLMAPRHIAMIGGDAAAEAVRQCREVGFSGEIWPVNQHRSSIGGLPCYSSVGELPAGPDAALVAVPGENAPPVVGELSERGAGGVVCHASGFAEHGPRGAELQRALVAAAGEMPLIGPNCIGVLNYLDGVALWPDQQGGRPVQRGVGIITQSGNIGQNMTMQHRGLPLAQLITVGNGAGAGVAELVEGMLDDPRITAIGLHLEGVDDVPGLSRAALRALRQRVPIAVLKSGASELGAQLNLSHTSSLAGDDELCDALFRRFGMARVHEVPAFLETLKFLHVHGALPGRRIASASCSGGEASLVADLAERWGLTAPEFPTPTAQRLQDVLGERVAVANPLDYHTYVWGDLQAQTDCFAEFLGAGMDCHLLVLDVPRGDRCDPAHWSTTAEAFLAARRKTSAVSCVVSNLPENLPEPICETLVHGGIAPMHGLQDCLAAVRAAADIGAAQESAQSNTALDGRANVLPGGTASTVDEHTGKSVLAEHGLEVPGGQLVRPDQAATAAAGLGFPVVVKASAADLVHKSDVGGVRVGLSDRGEVERAVAAMSGLADEFLVERVVDGAVAELIVGVRRDHRFGAALTIGAGGMLVELIRDAATLLLPTGRAEVEAALRGLRIWPLLAGFRGPAADVPAVVDAITAIAQYCRDSPGLVELDVNPLLALPRGRGAVAADVLIRRDDDDAEKDDG